jgi:hypothetical protein
VAREESVISTPKPSFSAAQRSFTSPFRDLLHVGFDLIEAQAGVMLSFRILRVQKAALWRTWREPPSIIGNTEAESLPITVLEMKPDGLAVLSKKSRKPCL